MPSPIILRNLRKTAIKAQIPYVSPQLNDLVHYWTMNESSGTREDLAGDWNLIPETGGSVNGVVGKNFNAAHFEDGVSDDLAGIGSYGALDDKATFSLWLKPASLDVGKMIFFLTDSIVVGALLYLAEGMVNPGDLAVIDSGSVWSYVTNGPALTVGVYNHLVLTYDMTARQVHIYVNGIEVAGTLTGNPYVLGTPPNSISLAGTSGGMIPNLDMDEVGIWSKIKTITEIVELGSKFYPF